MDDARFSEILAPILLIFTDSYVLVGRGEENKWKMRIGK